MASRGKRVLIGCGIGCLAILVLGIGSCIGFVVWLRQPGELLQPDRLVGADTAGQVAWTLRLEDSGTEEFVRNFFDSMQRLQERSRAELPSALNQWLSSMERRRNEQKMRELFPLVAAWTVRPARDGGDLHLFTLSMMRAGNRLVLTDWLLGLTLSFAPEIERVSHAGERIYRLPLDHGRSLTFFIRGNDLFFASDLDTACQAVDRLSSPAASAPAPEELNRLLAQVPADTPLRGAVSNEGGQFDRLWERFPGGPPPGNVVGAALAGRLVDAETFRLSLHVLYEDDDRARDDAGKIAGALQDALDESGLKVHMASSSDGQWAHVEIEIAGITDAIGRLVKIPDHAP
jgi:hypothetical protein